MRIYIPNTSKQTVGGGWTFLRNIQTALKEQAHFVNTWQECDIYLIVGVTITDINEVKEAKQAGKAIVFRVDGVPKKSRNKRMTPWFRMKQMAELSDLIIYQSEWSRQYCMPLTGDGTVIYNGVDTNIFYPADTKPDRPIYLFAYHGKSELKQFWVAHHYFQMMFRKNKQSEFWFINDFGRDMQALHEADFDFWNEESWRHLEKVDTAEGMAELMRQCTHLIFPSVADASPNTVLEAKACGLQVVGYSRSDMSGTEELVDLPMSEIGLDRMGDEYFAVLSLAMQNHE